MPTQMQRIGGVAFLERHARGLRAQEHEHERDSVIFFFFFLSADVSKASATTPLGAMYESMDFGRMALTIGY